jgi:hypothetical protein
MRAKIYGAIVAIPINFPKKLELLIIPLGHEDNMDTGDWSWPMGAHQSWEWVSRHYPVPDDAGLRLRAGERVTMAVGNISGEFPDGTMFPSGSEVNISATSGAVSKSSFQAVSGWLTGLRLLSRPMKLATQVATRLRSPAQ